MTTPSHKPVDGLCAVCGLNPRGAGGKLSRCLSCLRVDVDRDRQLREAKASKKAGLAEMQLPQVAFAPGAPIVLTIDLPATIELKRCRTCKAEKPLAHNGARDGKRLDCRECLLTGRRRPYIENKRERARRKVRQSKTKWQRPHAQSLEKWAERNPQAVQAAKLAGEAGRIQKAAHCQALGCTSTKHTEFHHNDYSRPLEVLTVCAAHHRRGHSAGYSQVAPGLPPHLGNVPPRP